MAARVFDNVAMEIIVGLVHDTQESWCVTMVIDFIWMNMPVTVVMNTLTFWISYISYIFMVNQRTLAWYYRKGPFCPLQFCVYDILPLELQRVRQFSIISGHLHLSAYRPTLPHWLVHSRCVFTHYTLLHTPFHHYLQVLLCHKYLSVVSQLRQCMPTIPILPSSSRASHTVSLQ